MALQDKKPGDTVYLQSGGWHTEAGEYTIEKVGRKYITLVGHHGARFDRVTGLEVSSYGSRSKLFSSTQEYLEHYGNKTRQTALYRYFTDHRSHNLTPEQTDHICRYLGIDVEYQKEDL